MNQAFLEQLMANPLATITDYYASCLAANPKAVDYLKRSMLWRASDAVSAVPLIIGFADRTLGKLIPPKALNHGKAVRSQLESLGVYRANGREHFRGFVTVPLHSTTGQVSGIYGHRIDRHGDGAAEQHIGQGIFNAAAIGRSDELIVTDNVLDAWSFYAAGHCNAICAIERELQIDDLANVRRVILASDSIDCEPFSKCEIHRLRFPLEHTANSYAMQRAHEADPLAKLIRGAAYVSGVAHATATILAPHDQAPGDSPPTFDPPASPVPGIVDEFDVESTDTETNITIEWRRWRVRGLERNTVAGVLKVNLLVYNDRSDRFHVDSFDLYHARSRRTFLVEAAEEIGAAESQLRSDLGRVLLKLEQLQHEQADTSRHALPSRCPVELTDAEQASALELLRDENLLDRILADFETCGIVGERTGKLVGYLAATSRLLDKPLGLIIQSSSAAGKSSLADAILHFMPEEQRFSCSAMTSQSLYYLGNENLKHKILSIAEQEGVRDASYQLKLLQSEGSLSLVSTSKEKGSGRTSTERYSVQGPVALLLTTTATDIDPELMNRCLVVCVDESPTQTAAIHAQQRFARTMQGFEQKLKAEKLYALHQNAQRVLRPLRIYNPYAEQLAFIGSQTRYRRDHEKYLTLINTITLLHQYQRVSKTIDVDGHRAEYLEVTRDDIALANRITDWALGRSIDELPGPTRRLLIELHDWTCTEARKQGIAATDFIFNRRQAREALQWNATWLRNQLERLVQQEYVIPHGRGQGKLHRYSLLYDGRGREGQPSLLGLVDPAALIEPSVATMTDHLAQD